MRQSHKTFLLQYINITYYDPFSAFGLFYMHKHGIVDVGVLLNSKTFLATHFTIDLQPHIWLFKED